VHAHLDDDLGAHGMGLGLSIVRESMEAMGGTVSVESSEGHGTTFTLRWPPERLPPASSVDGGRVSAELGPRD
jgi:signal transduction histidine kinase